MSTHTVFVNVCVRAAHSDSIRCTMSGYLRVKSVRARVVINRITNTALEVGIKINAIFIANWSKTMKLCRRLPGIADTSDQKANDSHYRPCRYDRWRSEAKPKKKKNVSQNVKICTYHTTHTHSHTQSMYDRWGKNNINPNKTFYAWCEWTLRRCLCICDSESALI